MLLSLQFLWCITTKLISSKSSLLTGILFDIFAFAQQRHCTIL
jgi:hypothetical protein